MAAYQDFLSDRTLRTKRCRIAALDFFNEKKAVRRNVEEHNVRSELLADSSDVGRGRDCKLLGRILVIEDLTPNIIEDIGSILKVDPLFFASHIYTSWRSRDKFQAPDLAVLPSRKKPHTFVNVHYHRTLLFCRGTLPARKILRDANIERKVVILPTTKAHHVGLAQHCVSTLRTTTWYHWICIVLVDPPINETYLYGPGGDQGMARVELPTQLFLGGYEDPTDTSFSVGKINLQRESTRLGLFDDLLYYWSSEPPGFDRMDPSLGSLSFYQLQVVAGEWVKYVAVMQSGIKQYEYSAHGLPSVLDQLGKLHSDLRSLQSWRRRSMSSKHKIKATSHFLRSNIASNSSPDKSLLLLLEDYEYIAARMDDSGQRLENMLPVVTSLVQIVDSQGAYAETANITRLTILALVFVPLTFVSSVFSMNTTNGPGGQYFWVYFVVAIPVTTLVLLVASPSKLNLRSLLRCIGRRNRRLHTTESPENSTDHSLGREV